MMKKLFISIPDECLIFDPHNRGCEIEYFHTLEGTIVIHSMKFEGITALGFSRNGSLEFLELVKKLANEQR